jgi:hypothetical protein
MIAVFWFGYRYAAGMDDAETIRDVDGKGVRYLFLYEQKY